MTNFSRRADRVPAFLAGGGELGALIAAFDWSATSLGPIPKWPVSLRSAVSIIVRSPVSMVMLWGADGVMIYNDAYSIFAGGRHPDLLGQKVLSGGWPEVAEFNANVLDVGLSGGTLAFRDQELTLHRSGRPEQVWMDLDYSPLPDDEGNPAGVVAIVVETTKQVTAERLRAAAEAKSRLEAERVQLALGAGAIVGTWFWDLTTDRFTVDAAFARSFGLDPALGFDGIPLEQIIATVHPDDRDGLLVAIDEAIGRGGAYAHQYRVRREDTKYHWIEANGHVERSADGTPLRFPGVVLDVSGRRAANEARRASEARLRLVFEEAKDHAILTTDPDGLVTSWSPGAAAIFGWPADEILGHPASVLFTPEDRASGVDVRELQSAAATGYAGDERWHIRKDGRLVFMSGSVRPLPADENGRPQGFMKIARDETERRRMLDELRKLNDTLEARVDERTLALRDSMDFARLALSAVGGVGVWTFDVAADAFTCDANVAKLYDIDPVEGAAGIARARFLANVHEEDRAILRATMHGGLVSPGDLELEYRIVHRDGSVHWVLSRGHTYFDEAGHPIRRTGVGVETTHQREMEGQLRQSQKMEAVGQLTGGIAHDFNNLLQGITGSLEIVRRRVAQGRFNEVDRFIAGASTAANRAAALTHRLLAFSRRQPLDPKPVRANTLAASMEDMLRRTIGERIELELVLAGGLWVTRCDSNQLESAILNLVINARDAMPDGGKLTIETGNAHLDAAYTSRQRDLQPGQYVCICVTDTGVGMDGDTISRAFEPFFTTKPIGQGTGLGLSMIYGFAQQSEGYAKIYSEVGKGTTFKLYLPRFRGEAEGEDALPQLTRAHAADQGEVVLVVEDDPVVRGLIVEELGELGYAALEAADGHKGLELLRSKRRIDLLVTDIGLPGLNGRQIADAARETRPNLKILFMTGYAENAALASGFLEPGMEMVTKPFAMEALAIRIRSMIEG